MFPKKNVKREYQINGLIDSISPLQIKGWAKGDLEPLKVHLKINNKNFKTYELKEYRSDVYASPKSEGNFGFTITFNKDYSDISLDNISIVAQDAKNNEKRLIYKKDPNLTEKLIKSIISNNLIGRDGHVDGIYKNEIIGWAGDFVFKRQLSIWLHSNSRNDAVEIFCNEFRNDLETKNINSLSGFRFDLKTLKNVKCGTILFLSFDKEGIHKLPSENTLLMPNTELLNNEIEIMPNQESLYYDKFFEEKMTTSTDELRDKWNKLKKSNLYINLINKYIEDELNRRSKKKSFFTKIKSFLGIKVF